MRENLVRAVLSVPLSDPAALPSFAGLGRRELALALAAWLGRVREADPNVEVRLLDSREDGRARYYLQSGKGLLVNTIVFDEKDLSPARLLQTVEALGEVMRSNRTDPTVIFLCTPDVTAAAAAAASLQALNGDAPLVLVEPLWAAAVLIEQQLPMFLGTWHPTGAPTAHPPAQRLPAGNLPTERRQVTLSHVRDDLSEMVARVVDETGMFDDRLKAARSDFQYGGQILLATTFLPSVTQPPTAISRFYRWYGASDDVTKLIVERSAIAEAAWIRHIARYRRIDIIDRLQLEEYLAAPEYYQMLLTTEELAEQIDRLERLIFNDNYTLCLAPEAVDIAFEIRSHEVRIRTDRRNKGRPRMGRISSLILRDAEIRRVFEREFWNLFRSTEDEFRDKQNIMRWIRSKAAAYGGPRGLLTARTRFDVFLCHNSNDKPAVRELAQQLKARGVNPWFDEWCLVPGQPWQRALESAIGSIGAVAVCIGPSGFGPWHTLEMEAALRQFATRGLPVIPVLLPGANRSLQMPLFLSGMHAVDLARSDRDPISDLMSGIRGQAVGTGL